METPHEAESVCMQSSPISRQQVEPQATNVGAGSNGRKTLKPGPHKAQRPSRMTVQVRYRWQIAPLSDLFVVYNRNASLFEPTTEKSFLELLDDAFGEPQREALLVKLRYRFGR